MINLIRNIKARRAKRQSIKEKIAQVKSQNAKLLNFSNFELKRVPNEIRQLKQLQILRLKNNKLKTIPDWIYELENLEVLDLRANELQEIPTPIFQIKKLKVLDLAENRIVEIPAEVNQLIQLRRWFMFDNLIEKIPENLDGLVELQYLDLGMNQISSIGKAIESLSNLTTLKMYQNRISQVKLNFNQLSQLGVIDFSVNEINEISTSIVELHSLKYLILYSNQLTHFPSIKNGGLKKFVRLNLADNNLKEVPAGIDQGITLDLYFNHFDTEQLTKINNSNVEKILIDKEQIEYFVINGKTHKAIETIIGSDNYIKDFFHESVPLHIKKKYNLKSRTIFEIKERMIKNKKK